MPAIITDNFKRDIIERLIKSIDSAGDSYYIGIGRSEQWNDSDITTTPTNTRYDERGFRHSLQSIKSAEDYSYVIPRNNWTAGTIYAAYDDAVSGNSGTPFYVYTDENNVYICIERARNADGSTKTSTIKPTGTGTGLIVPGDGYTWKYLYTIPTGTAVKFLSSNFMPVKITDSDQAIASPTIDGLQWAVQQAAIDGEILNIVITNGGSGYTTAPTVVIEGNGTGATATAVVASGQVKRITMVTHGSGYDYAKVYLTGGTGSGATARAVISPSGGIGADPRFDLKSKAIMFNTKPDGIESGNFIVGNDFRQVGLILNPTNYSGTPVIGLTAMALKTMRLTTTGDAATFTLNTTIEGTVSGTQAILDYVDSDTLYWHQNLDTGFGSFDSDIGSTIFAPGATGTVLSLIDSADVDNMSGKLLYLENRAAVTRDAAQTEDIKITIQL